MSLVKICGITEICDAVKCVELGVHFLGFIFASSPRQVRKTTVKNILRVVAADIKSVGVFTEESDYVLDIMNDCDLDYAQLHGDFSEMFVSRLGLDRVIRVCRVADEQSLAEIESFNCAKYILMDTYKKNQAGGTGEVFDWDLAIKAKEYGKPIFLAGGLNPSNIQEAILKVEPFAVDISSGVELEPGIKDHNKLEELFYNVRTITQRP